MSSKISGICHICGKKTELTFEHLPPRKANNNRAKAIVGDELTKHIAGNDKPWDFSSCKYKDLQKGMGLYSLCQSCNNTTSIRNEIEQQIIDGGKKVPKSLSKCVPTHLVLEYLGLDANYICEMANKFA